MVTELTCLIHAQFKYRITQGPAEHMGKTYVSKAGLAKLYSNHSRGRTDLSVFAFVNSGGPKIKRSKRSRGVAVMLGNNDIASISVDSADKHPLACCARIILELAGPILCPHPLQPPWFGFSLCLAQVSA
jgi:hypothetical protein